MLNDGNEGQVGLARALARRSTEDAPKYFGRGLRYLRESYSRRMSGAGGGPALESRTSIQSVVNCLKALDYPISVAALSELENGINWPKDSLLFIDKVAICLRLTEREKDDLVERLAFDILFSRFGGELARRLTVHNPDWEQS